MKHLCERLEALAVRHPDRDALIAPGGDSRTFRALRDAAACVSGRLDALGVGPHVMLLIPVSIPLYEVLLGVFWGGRTAVLVDPSLPRDRLDAALERVGIDALVSVPKGHLLRLRARSLRGLGHYLSTRRIPGIATSIYGGSPGILRLPIDGEPALLTFTTGTSGVPKAMGRSHRFLLAQHDILAGHMGLDDTDVDLPTLPVFLLNSLAAGATCVLPDGDLRNVATLSPERLTAQVHAHDVTTSSGSPAFFAPWVAHLQQTDAVLPQLTKLFTGGARVPAPLLASMMQVFPNARIHVLYGSTEAEPMASIDAREVLDETGDREVAGDGSCVGKPVLGVSVRLVNPDTGVDARDGEPGEVWVTGDHVNQGYYNDPAADHANKVHDGEQVWHRTGDVGWQDAHDRLWLVGRTDSRVAGRYPFPVEARIEAHSGVVRAALVEHGGAAVLVYTGTADEDVIAQLADVDRAVCVARMPVDPRHRAKIDRAAVRRLL